MSVPNLNEPIASPMAPLFSEGLKVFGTKPSPTKLRQQLLTNCPLPALLAAMANVDKGWLQSMVQERSVPAESWFFNKPVTSGGKFKVKRIISVRFQHATVDVSPILYFNSLMKPRFTYSDDGSGWASYVEKAYVAYRAQFQYSNLDLLSAGRPLTVERIMEDLVHDFSKLEINGSGGGVLYRDLEPEWLDPGVEDIFGTTDATDLSKKTIKKKLAGIFKLAHERATIATTPDGVGHGLVGSHTYAVLRYRDGVVTVFDAMRVKEHKIKPSDFLKAFDAVFQARPKN